MMREIRIRFAPTHILPPGYVVEWWEQDERYHWRLGETYGDLESSRWSARRGAWAHFRAEGIKT